MNISQVSGVVPDKQRESVFIETDGENGKNIVRLSGTIFVSGFWLNLFSLQCVRQAEYSSVCGENEGKVVIKKRVGGGELIQVACLSERDAGRLTLNGKVVLRDEEELLKLQPAVMKMGLSMDLHRKRLGHSEEAAILRMLRGGLVDGTDGVKKGTVGVCHVCKLGKLAAHPHPTVPIEQHESQQLALVVADLVGRNKQIIFGEKMYDMVLVDTFSKKSWVVMLTRRSDAAANRWHGPP